VIDIQNLKKSYGNYHALRGLDLQVAKGEIFGFLGPNGAGKTTTIRLLMGILVPTSGKATIAGLDCHKDRVDVKKRVGYMPDVPVFYDYLRGREILEFVGEMHGLPRPEARKKARVLLRALALGDTAEEYAANYSMGMKSKLGIACAFIHDPDVLILDEPANGLDPRAARDVYDLILASAAEGKTVFLSSHLLDMVERLCTRIGIIYEGRLVAEGPPQQLKEEVVSGGSLEHLFMEVTRDREPEPESSLVLSGE